MASAQQAGKYKDEIVPMKTKMKVVNRETKEESIVDYEVNRDECNRPDTTIEGLARLEPVRGPGNFITAGNASQLSDGAAAVVLMEAKEAERRGLKPMGVFKGWAVAGCAPDEMGIGPVFAVPRLLERHGLKVEDIDLWELNEAFASQCLYCRDTLGIDPDKYNVNGGSIAIGHPFGMTERLPHRPCPARGSPARQRQTRGGDHSIGGGQGGAGLFERSAPNQDSAATEKPVTSREEVRDDELRRFAADGAAPLPAADAQGCVEHDTARIWYGVYGSGPPVILLHGAFDNSEDWGYQVAALVDAGFRAVTIDNRGRGRSTLGTKPLSYGLQAAEVLAVMDALDLDCAAIVGWSDGAIIALTLAMTSPSRVDRVFAFGTAMDQSGLKDVSMDNPLLGRVFGRAKQDYARLSPVPEAFEATANALSPMHATEPNHTAAELATIQTRVAVVLGEFDEFVTMEHADYLARQIPGAERIILPGVSHFALLQRPGEFNNAMLAFLRDA